MHRYLGQILRTNQHSVCRVRWQQWCRSLHDNTERVRADGLGGFFFFFFFMDNDW